MLKKLIVASLIAIGFSTGASAQTEEVVTKQENVAAQTGFDEVMLKLATLKLSKEQNEKAAGVLRFYYPNGTRTLTKQETADRDRQMLTLLYPNQAVTYQRSVSKKL